MAVVRPPLGLVLSWLPHGSVKMDFVFGVYRQVTWKKQIRIISPDVHVLIGVLIKSMGLFVVLCVRVRWGCLWSVSGGDSSHGLSWTGSLTPAAFNEARWSSTHLRGRARLHTISLSLHILRNQVIMCSVKVKEILHLHCNFASIKGRLLV